MHCRKRAVQGLNRIPVFSDPAVSVSAQRILPGTENAYIIIAHAQSKVNIQFYLHSGLFIKIKYSNILRIHSKFRL